MKQLTESQLREIQSLMADRQKIESVKRYREWVGCSLAEAKNAVEAIEAEGSGAASAGDRDERPSAVDSRRSGCLSALLIPVAFAATLWGFRHLTI